jgi:hypothetical protein
VAECKRFTLIPSPHLIGVSLNRQEVEAWVGQFATDDQADAVALLRAITQFRINELICFA